MQGEYNMATSEAVRGAGLLTNFWKRVETAIRKVGGTDEHLARLDKAEAVYAIEQFAELMVHGVATRVAWFRFLIRLGHFDYLYGFAEKPEEIEGQVFHLVTGETKLDHPGVMLTTQQVCDRYGDQMADLSEFLDYAIRNPEAQREKPIGIVWKVGAQFWYAYLYSDGSHRKLYVYRDYPDVQWLVSDRFLVRK